MFAGSPARVRFRLTASYFLCEQKVTKESLRGKTRSAPNAEGRVLRSSVFPLRTPRRERFCGNAETADAARLQRGTSPPLRNPQPCGADERVCASIDRRGVTGYTKPLVIANAPMEVVVDFRAVGWRLPSWFACGCGSANECKPCKSAPVQRQRK